MRYTFEHLKFFCFILLVASIFSCKSAHQSYAQPAEPHRPIFHFTPPAHWMNDPNGMVYYEGEYHLFYQHYPDGIVWGPMHWGHAVSKDMVKWEHLPIALYPDSLGLIFSGSVVVDWKNTSGFGKNGKPPLVAIFTHHLMEGEKAGRHDFQYQSIAFSNDNGRTWTKYAGNPVIPNTEKIHDFRDPKMMWDKAHEQWLLVFAAHDHVMFWSSKNLINWTHLSNFGKEYGAHGGVLECPDFFPIKIKGSSEIKWVLLISLNPGAVNGGSGTQYFVGDFDGKTFTLDKNFETTVRNGNAQWLDWGRDNYAGVTWSDIPEKDGRRLFIGWMSNWDYASIVPTEKWRSATTLPRELTLHQTTNGYRLFSQPVKELQSLRGKAISLKNTKSKDGLDLTQKHDLSQCAFELELEIELSENTKTDVAVVLSNNKNETYRVGFDVSKNEFYSDRTKAGKHFSDKFATKRHSAPRMSKDKTLKMHLYFDVASCELFADDGSVVMTDIFFPTEDFNQFKLVGVEGKILVKNGKIFNLAKPN